MKTKLIRGTILAVAAVLATASVVVPRYALAKTPDVERGRKLFNQHCASCHGTDAKGHGPVAPSLKVSPTDLTAIQKDRRGKDGAIDNRARHRQNAGLGNRFQENQR